MDMSITNGGRRARSRVNQLFSKRRKLETPKSKMGLQNQSTQANKNKNKNKRNHEIQWRDNQIFFLAGDEIDLYVVPATNLLCKQESQEISR